MSSNKAITPLQDRVMRLAAKRVAQGESNTGEDFWIAVAKEQEAEVQRLQDALEAERRQRLDVIERYAKTKERYKNTLHSLATVTRERERLEKDWDITAEQAMNALESDSTIDERRAAFERLQEHGDRWAEVMRATTGGDAGEPTPSDTDLRELARKLINVIVPVGETTDAQRRAAYAYLRNVRAMARETGEPTG